MKLPIYMDYQATTPLDPIVFTEMEPYFLEKFGNPHSGSHMFGWEAEEAIENARTKIAEIINANSKEIIFTSGATEANNMVIKGLAEFYSSQKKHIITLSTEHKCVLECCTYLEKKGFEITYLKPEKQTGLLDIKKLKSVIREDTLLVSIMALHNEIGTIQPIEEIGKICREHNIFFHTDAAQAFGKIPLDVEKMNIDLMSISGHKIYGPKGVGALYLRRRPRIRLAPMILGGGQERGFRSGTLPTPLIVGLGKAAEIAGKEMKSERVRLKKLKEKFFRGIKKQNPEFQINGDFENGYEGNLNISFLGINNKSMLSAIRDLAVSSGSACASSSLEPSYVLKEIGVKEDASHASIRFGIGRFTTEAEITKAIEIINNSI